MKLLNHLFEIVEMADGDAGFSTTIKIFPDHIVFKGHFPGYPVTPGVILLQIIHELIEHRLGKKIRLMEMMNCKFLKVVSPGEETLLTLSITLNVNDKALHVKASGENKSEPFLKLVAIYYVE